MNLCEALDKAIDALLLQDSSPFWQAADVLKKYRDKTDGGKNSFDEIVDMVERIKAIELQAGAYLKTVTAGSDRARKAAKYISSWRWRENPGHVVSYGALYGKFLAKLPPGRPTGAQTVKALAWFYERLYVVWKLEG